MAGSFFLSVGKQSLGSGTRFTQQAYIQVPRPHPGASDLDCAESPITLLGRNVFSSCGEKIKNASVLH